VFRRRLTTSDLPAPAGLAWMRVREALGGHEKPAVDPADLA
jgi:cytochrome d ubiquinol oxidase subunit II